MANATVAGLGSLLAGVMIETTTDAIHARRLWWKRHQMTAENHADHRNGVVC
jgi:hypothetical protein